MSGAGSTGTCQLAVCRVLDLPEAEGVLEVWLVDDGATVTEGQPIYSLETEKVVMEIAAPSGGVLQQIGAAGGTYQVGELVGRIE